MRSGLLIRTRRLACALTLGPLILGLHTLGLHTFGLHTLGLTAGTAQAQAVKFAPRGDYDLMIRQTVQQTPGMPGRKARIIPGLPDTIYRLERYHQGWMRMDGMLDENGSKLKAAASFDSGYMLVNNDKKMGFNITVADGKPKAEKLPMDGAAAAEVAKQLVPKPTGETLTIAGEKCNVMSLDIDGTVAKTCVTPDGLTLRMEMQQGPNLIVHEAVKLNFRSQNAADFVPPTTP